MGDPAHVLKLKLKYGKTFSAREYDACSLDPET